MDDIESFAKITLSLGLVFDKPVSTELSLEYWSHLKPYGIENITLAANEIKKTHKFFPRISDFVDLIEGSNQELAQIAWKSVLEGLRDPAGAMYTPEIKAAIGLIGGARRLSKMSYRELEFKAKEFKDVYQHKKILSEKNLLEQNSGGLGYEH
jgi:hypothetical protein